MRKINHIKLILNTELYIECDSKDKKNDLSIMHLHKIKKTFFKMAEF
jgi:hypothetical protein